MPVAVISAANRRIGMGRIIAVAVHAGWVPAIGGGANADDTVADSVSVCPGEATGCG